MVGALHGRLFCRSLARSTPPALPMNLLPARLPLAARRPTVHAAGKPLLTFSATCSLVAASCARITKLHARGAGGELSLAGGSTGAAGPCKRAASGDLLPGPHVVTMLPTRRLLG